MRLCSPVLAALVATAGFLSVNPAAALNTPVESDRLQFAQATPPAAPSTTPERPGDRTREARTFSPKAMCQNMVARGIGKRAYLKARLDLKPEQMSAWNAYEKAADDVSAKDKARCAALPQERPTTMSYLDRQNLREEFMKSRLEAIQATKPALQALYASLTPEQKEVLDSPRGTRMGRMHHRGHR